MNCLMHLHGRERKQCLRRSLFCIADKIVGGYEENVSILDKHKGFMDAIQYKILQSTPQLLYVHFW